ncbi:class Ib ribonucleoside-diphosphate reductase assembly flavoprotein NrdI [Corynebacterium sp. CCM 8864]|uniref:Protein NrdI n=2 Tax=Corynebacterium marambiense TaxID=2765364 RepID=A0ABS0VX59_9CORY|nr:class Ib ribonucleoside-diphosphate reductase assembly flavoprotein NrdI [Corynebacterium marambiense]
MKVRDGVAMSEPHIVYFSSVSGNTARFVDKLGISAERIPLRAKEPQLEVTEPFVLITPTYGGGSRAKAVPKQVIRFLNNPDNRALLRGVITSGNTNFGEAFCYAGPIIAAKCGVPELYRFELLGTTGDVERVRAGLIQFFADAPATRVGVDK